MIHCVIGIERKMIIKFDVESDLYGQIENLVKEGKYQDAIQFIKIAITNQLQEEKSDMVIGEPLRDLSEITGEINTLRKNSFEELEKLIENLDSMKFESSEIGKKYEDFIWSFYNRLFPIKIAIYQLAEMSIEKIWVNLEEWKEIAVMKAQNWDKTLSEYELKNGKMKADDIHEVFEKREKEIAEYYEYVPEELDPKGRRSKLVQARVATMGRLSELKIVDWEIISSVSHYSLNKEKMNLLGL